MLAWHLQLAPPPFPRLCSSCQGMYDFCGEAHVHLSDAIPGSSQKRTSRAEPYPTAMCTAWAKWLWASSGAIEANRLNEIAGH
eukprot:6904867-Pyramimonas_sp.AAC.1